MRPESDKLMLVMPTNMSSVSDRRKLTTVENKGTLTTLLGVGQVNRILCQQQFAVAASDKMSEI